MDNIDIISRIKTVENIEGSLKDKFDLSWNPFPKSGIANIDTDDVTGYLVPAYEETTQKIIEYMQDALSMSGVAKDDKYLSLIIRGDYGTGKTQTLMYIKYLFGKLRNSKFKPYVIYIDNPGVRLSELIGNILSQIGIENFRRYLWDIFLNFLDEKDKDESDETRKEILFREIKAIKGRRMPDLFANNDQQPDDFTWEKVSISYKYLLDSMLNGVKPTEQRTVVTLFKNYLLKCFTSRYELSSIAEYFYDIVTDNISVSKSWDQLITGNVKNIDKREFHLLHAIVEISKKYLDATDFVILVDEFEEIAIGRLKEADVDNYLRNLRTLIDKDKNWCSVFAMNGAAYKRIELVSPPLASRIGDRKIDLKPLTEEALVKIVGNYLALARLPESAYPSIYPFSEDALKMLLNVKDVSLQGSPRFVLKTCYLLLQRAAEYLEKGQWITDQFVKENIKEQIKLS